MKKWIAELLDKDIIPYVATSESYLDYLDLSLFDGRESIKLLENDGDRDFHEAYLVSNSLAFGNPDLKMPNWVYLDCVLMQTAVVGFAVPVDKAPLSLLDFYEKDPWVNVSKLDIIPISGQIAARGVDGRNLIGYSLFSLNRQLSAEYVSRLAVKTKYAALSVLRAESVENFMGISQYDNKALLIHSRFGKEFYIEQATAMLHPLRDMSFTYRIKTELDESRIFGEVKTSPERPDFLVKSDDLETKLKMQRRMKDGEKFRILDPVHIVQEDGLYLPIKSVG